MEKIALPIKTKIAAWWMLIVGIISSVLFLWTIIQLLELYLGDSTAGMVGLETALTIGFSLYTTLLSLIVALFSFIPSIFLFKRGFIKWKVSIVNLMAGLIAVNTSSLLFFIFVFNDFFERRTTLSSFEIFGLIIELLTLIIIPCAFLAIPFFLLLSDRKNFQKSSF